MAVRKNTNKKISFKLVLLFVIAGFVLLIVGKWAVSNYQSSKQAQAMLGEIQQRQNSIESRLNLAQARNELLETDTGVQDFLIEKYAVKRAGERVLVLVRDENEQEIIVEPELQGFWSRMGQIFFE